MANPVRIFGPEKSRSPVINWNARLDGILARMRLHYIERCQRWDLRVGAADGTIIILGQRITVGWDMWSPYTDSRLPPGSLTVIDAEGRYDQLPGIDGWRGRFWFLYQSPDPVVDDRDLLTTQFVEPPEPE